MRDRLYWLTLQDAIRELRLALRGEGPRDLYGHDLELMAQLRELRKLRKQELDRRIRSA